MSALPKADDLFPAPSAAKPLPKVDDLFPAPKAKGALPKADDLFPAPKTSWMQALGQGFAFGAGNSTRGIEQLMGRDLSAEQAARHEVDRAHPIAGRVGEFAGGMVDVVSLLAGLTGEGIATKGFTMAAKALAPEAFDAAARYLGEDGAKAALEAGARAGVKRALAQGAVTAGKGAAFMGGMGAVQEIPQSAIHTKDEAKARLENIAGNAVVGAALAPAGQAVLAAYRRIPDAWHATADALTKAVRGEDAAKVAVQSRVFAQKVKDAQKMVENLGYAAQGQIKKADILWSHLSHEWEAMKLTPQEKENVFHAIEDPSLQPALTPKESAALALDAKFKALAGHTDQYLPHLAIGKDMQLRAIEDPQHTGVLGGKLRTGQTSSERERNYVKFVDSAGQEQVVHREKIAPDTYRVQSLLPDSKSFKVRAVTGTQLREQIDKRFDTMLEGIPAADTRLRTAVEANRQKALEPLKSIGASDIRMQDENGKLGAFKNATVKEIESAAPQRYLKDPWLARSFRYVEDTLAQQSRTAKGEMRTGTAARGKPSFEDIFQKGLEESPAIRAVAVHQGDMAPEGYIRSKALPDYWLPKPVAHTMDYFFARAEHYSRIPGLRTLNNLTRAVMLKTPIVGGLWHVMNIAMTELATSRMSHLVNPVELVRGAKLYARALKSVVTQDNTYLDLLARGAPLMQPNILSKDLYVDIVRQTRDALGVDKSFMEAVQARFKEHTPEVLKAFGRLLSPEQTEVRMWQFNDMVYVKHVMELEARGKTPEQAVAMANRSTITYRVPIQHSFSRLLTHPDIAWFTSYKWSILRIVAHMAGSIFGTDHSPAERIAGLDQAVSLALTTFVLLPLLDRVLPPGYQFVRFGATSVPNTLANVMGGKKSISSLGGLVVTPAPGTMALGGALTGVNPYTGKHVSKPGASVARQFADRAGYLASTPIEIPWEESRGDPRKFLQEYVQGQFGIQRKPRAHGGPLTPQEYDERLKRKLEKLSR